MSPCFCIMVLLNYDNQLHGNVAVQLEYDNHLIP